jgi:hypothetical protein
MSFSRTDWPTNPSEERTVKWAETPAYGFWNQLRALDQDP